MFANIATSLTVNDYYNHLYVYSYLSVFFYSKLTYFSSMIREVIRRLGIYCTIFWASDFKFWREASKVCYSKRFPSIASFAVFSGSPLLVQQYKLWKSKPRYSLYTIFFFFLTKTHVVKDNL